jgi:hypothetical protein
MPFPVDAKYVAETGRKLSITFPAASKREHMSISTGHLMGGSFRHYPME